MCDTSKTGRRKMKRSRVWTGLSSVCAFFLAVLIIAMNCMMGYQGTINGALGIQTSKIVTDEADNANTTYFESKYGELNSENLQKLIHDAHAESVAEEEEGAVLLRNENKALPLAEGEKRVTLFGHAVAEPLYKNASAGSDGYKGEYCISLYQALTDAGFEINDTLFDAYKASKTARGTGAYSFQTNTVSEFSMGEESIAFYTDSIQASWENDYNDVAIIMFAREGGEGVELKTEDAEGISQLALHQDEKDLLQMIKDSGKFTKTIVLLNSGNPMEVNWLDEYGIDACLWIGCPGQSGFEAVANLLTGKTNPSGRLTDTYAVSSLSAPSVVNGSFHNQNWTNLEEVLEKSTENDEDISWYSVQAEGIYLGYKYYETRYEDCILGQGNADSSKGSLTGAAWNYNDEVVYPFGYGLSYTDFTETLDEVQIDGDEITVKVTVTNTGEMPGKRSVQVYSQTPYGDYEKENKVEKSAIQLLDFGKTGLLQPGESEQLTISGDKYLLTSYDYTSAKGYILSEGTYYLAIGTDAHDALNNILAAKGAKGMVAVDGTPAKGNPGNTYTWEEKLDTESYHNSRYTGEEVTNQFDDCDINAWIQDAVTYLSRSDWDATYPVGPTMLAATDEMITVLNGEYYTKADDAKSVSDFTQGDNQGIPLAALIGLDYDDPMWETYLNQFTIEELTSQLADTFGSSEIATVGKPAVMVGDGPDGVGGMAGKYNEKLYGDGRDSECFPCENILAATFSRDLLTQRAELMAEECLYMNLASDWMPGGNLHRTPFGGRNFEYYSEDAVLTYLCAIPEVQTMEKKGVHAGMKHMVGNDQEINRMGISVFFNEQAFREGALKGFEGALAVGGGKAVMHGFNRLGMVWCSANRSLCTQVAVNEWGFIGQQQTDAVASNEGYVNHFASSLMAGTDNYCLDFAGKSARTVAGQIMETDDGDLLEKVREADHEYLYIIANSAVMNGYSTNSRVVSITPWWKPLMNGLICAFGILELFSLGMMLFKKPKEKIIVEEEQIS